MAFVKTGGVFCDGFQKRPNAVWKALRILSSLIPTAVDLSDHEREMAMDILFKPRVETRELMAQTDHFGIQESKRAQNLV